MAYEDSLRSITLDADSSLAVWTSVPGQPGSADPNGGYQYYFVKVTGARTCGLADGDAGEVVIGVLQNKPQVTGQAATVGIRGISLVTAGAQINAGSPVKNSSGKAVTATLTGQGADDFDTVLGIALATASGDGVLIPVLLKV